MRLDRNRNILIITYGLHCCYYRLSGSKLYTEGSRASNQCLCGLVWTLRETARVVHRIRSSNTLALGPLSIFGVQWPSNSRTFKSKSMTNCTHYGNLGSNGQIWEVQLLHFNASVIAECKPVQSKFSPLKMAEYFDQINCSQKRLECVSTLCWLRCVSYGL